MILSELLYIAQKKGLLHPLDLHFARAISREEEPLLMLSAALVSRNTREGHVCLLLDKLNSKIFFSDIHQDLAQMIWISVGAPENIKDILLAHSSVSDGRLVAPLVLDKERLYLYRMWFNEVVIAKFIQEKNSSCYIDEQKTRKILDRYFGRNVCNFQKISVAVALTRKIAIISGGPGTGKTTTVTKFLASFIELSSKPQSIKVVSPTGKSALKLSEALGNAIKELKASDHILRSFPREAVTLHRLLDIIPNSHYCRFCAENPLKIDVLVIDEASMIDLAMMSRLITALPHHARVLFLGDRNQLASIEAGSVFSDFCYHAENYYSFARAEQLARLTGCKLSKQIANQNNLIGDMICVLTKNYRFKRSSGIGQLALAVNNGQVQHTEKILNGKFSDVCRIAIRCKTDYQKLLESCSEGYSAYLSLIHAGAKPYQVLTAFRCFQVLCAVHNGLFGAIELNKYIENMLHQVGLIRKDLSVMQEWYIGRPVMIMSNDQDMQLFNGEVGIAMEDCDREIKVWFLLSNGNIAAVKTCFLPLHDTAFAMTIHKSQGSEFDHAVVILPNQIIPILTRQLVYTAITRAKKKLTIYSKKLIFESAVRACVSRQSGLRDRIFASSQDIMNHKVTKVDGDC
ncbi:exodeoxyribonuclease V subunit alpha [Candidatus Erwinia haradaeae]|uniref:RecBCD enzyme subunit RecD n=1 Tax=Candidatus Erwinia haradaeae TaxID=1922217 RepID=A0A451DPA8_9GAMM|nr:exodeoxyribonuclease V subunit alpha [Candidatus Erwinia haradaeae]VFP88644.1 RecBCD enzyme subunit RecD [Candidatus Erwinia haradaeae]